LDPNPSEELTWKSDSVLAGSPSISVIVTSYSNERLQDLKDLLDSVASQKPLDQIELVVIIERERNLFEEVTAFLRTKVGLSSSVFFYPKLNGMSEARNIGATMSCGRYLAFVDDDAILEKEWLRSLEDAIDEQDIVAATGPSRPLWVGRELDWFPKELSWIIGSTEWFDSNSLAELRNAWGQNMVVRRDEFAAVNGFCVKYGLHGATRSRWFDPPSEDVDLSLRLREKFGIPILFIPGLSVRHKVKGRKISLGFVAQRSYSTGYQRRAIKNQYLRIGNLSKEPLSLERGLIPRMLTLLPRSAAGFPKSPRKSANVIVVAFVSLLFSALGYLDFRTY
jgi:GT2 family glycosyltransferase